MIDNILKFKKKSPKHKIGYTHIADYSCMYCDLIITLPFPEGLESSCRNCQTVSMKLIDNTVRKMPPARK